VSWAAWCSRSFDMALQGPCILLAQPCRTGRPSSSSWFRLEEDAEEQQGCRGGAEGVCWQALMQRFPSLLELYPGAALSDSEGEEPEAEAPEAGAGTPQEPAGQPAARSGGGSSAATPAPPAPVAPQGSPGGEGAGTARPDRARAELRSWAAAQQEVDRARRALEQRERDVAQRECAAARVERRQALAARRLEELRQRLDEYGEDIGEGIADLAAQRRALRGERRRGEVRLRGPACSGLARTDGYWMPPRSGAGKCARSG
ncbi:unnamed protein product, partial [Prorocentrum cordatum]